MLVIDSTMHVASGRKAVQQVNRVASGRKAVQPTRQGAAALCWPLGGVSGYLS